MISSHWKKMAETQARLDEKTGKKNTSSAPTAPSIATTPKDAGGKKKDWEWLEDKVGSDILTVLFVIAAIVVSWLGIYSDSPWKNPTLANTGSWSQNHWLWILILAGIIAILIVRIFSGKTATTLQAVLWVAVFMLLICFPTWNGIVGTSNTPQASSRSEIPLASAPVSTWTKVVLPLGGKENIPVPSGMRAMVSGSKLRVHTVYADGNECVRASEGAGSDTVCPGQGIGVYVSNAANETNIISFAYEEER